MINKITNRPKPLFCEKYWARRLKKKTPLKEHISYTFDIHEVNHFLLGEKLFKAKSCISTDPLLTIQDIITITDKEFKELKPTKKQMTLWRGIEPLSSYIERFKKSYYTQKGDIIYMPEYAYAADEKRYSEGFTNLGDKKGILYEITVPKGSRLSHKTHYIFPRYSKFECSETIETENYKLIKLNYLPR